MNTLAIVIGNNNYYRGYELDNAVHDAQGIAEAFQKLGYTVIHRENITVSDSEEILQEFEAELPKYDASIFYFAGHGFQVDGENFLATTDCQISNNNRYHFQNTCITLSNILDVLKKNSTKVNIVIIDACRRSFDRGPVAAFSPITAPKGTLIAFSTSPNEGAKDAGPGSHSIYTGTLLKYISRQSISVEELFKKVRKTVYTLTDGEQTTWEHTSLIGDFYFNSGQMVHSLSIPYDTLVVKDADYVEGEDQFSKWIILIKAYDWAKQNPAIDNILETKPDTLDKNQCFIFGRNLLQAAEGSAFSATGFFSDLADNLKPYNVGNENHVLNGILFEIYFDSHGEFRQRKLKTTDYFDKIMSLRKDVDFDNSFDFIRRLIEPYRELPLWIPEKKDIVIDVDILATKASMTNPYTSHVMTYDVISSIITYSQNILPEISKYGIIGKNELALKNTIAHFLGAPANLVQINSNVTIESVAFKDSGTSLDNGY